MPHPALVAAEDTMFWSRAGQLLALMGATSLIASCAPYNVRTDYDDEVSFSQFRTFAWMDTTRRREGETDNPFLERRVKRAVETVMAERGLSPAEGTQADVLVTAFVVGPSSYDRSGSRWLGSGCGPSLSVWFAPRYSFGYRRRYSPFFFPSAYWPDPWGYACSYRVGYGYGWLPLYGSPGRQMAGTLVVDILDREKHELLWRGTAEGALIDARRTDQQQESIDKIVREVLKEYPPKN
jgi:hypothetical protein